MHTPSNPRLATPNELWRQSEQRFLRWAIGLSILFHFCLLAWQRSAPLPPTNIEQALEVVMVNAATELAPTQARLLAQNNINGGGSVEAANASHSLPHTGETDARVDIEMLIKKQLQLEAEQKSLLSRLKSAEAVAIARSAPHFMKESNAQGLDDTNQENQVQSAKLAILSQQVQDYNKRPHKHFDAPSTRAIRYASYIDQWRQRVEQIGVQHYPRNAGKAVFGTVQATLTIRSDGTLFDITIDRPADQAILNQAVLRIAQLSAPYGAFPPDMAKEIDQLVVTRTWQFVNGVLQTQAP